jgi:hypothetical protein
MSFRVRLIFFFVFPFVFLFWWVSSAFALFPLPPGVTVVGSIPEGGGLAQLSNGEYGLFPESTSTDVYQIYVKSDYEALLRRATALELESGATGQGAAEVSGMTAEDIAKSDAIHTELQDLGPNIDPEIANEIVGESRFLGALPSEAAVVDALAGATAVGGVALLGVAIGTGIDEIWGLPTLFDGGGTNKPYEELTRASFTWSARSGGVKLVAFANASFE